MKEAGPLPLFALLSMALLLLLLLLLPGLLLLSNVDGKQGDARRRQLRRGDEIKTSQRGTAAPCASAPKTRHTAA